MLSKSKPYSFIRRSALSSLFVVVFGIIEKSVLFFDFENNLLNIFPPVEFLFNIPFYRQFRLCITKASGKTHAPILLCIIRRSTNVWGSRKCILRVLHSHRGYELYGR